MCLRLEGFHAATNFTEDSLESKQERKLQHRYPLFCSLTYIKPNINHERARDFKELNCLSHGWTETEKTSLPRTCNYKSVLLSV